jgi:RNA polymerase sigma factor (sigma-70 family)
MSCVREERMLLDAVCAQAPGAVERFVAACAPVIKTQLRAMGARAGYDLEDLVQEVLIAAVAAIAAGRFGGRSTLATWLCAFAHRRVVDAWRRRPDRVASTIETPGGRARAEAAAVPDQAGAVLLGELIAALPPREALVFRRCCLEGVAIRGVAREVGRSVSRAYVDLARAKAQIHQGLTGHTHTHTDAEGRGEASGARGRV